MKVLKVFALVVVLALMTTARGFAADLKIGYVDLAKVFDNYQETKDFDAQLQAQGEEFSRQRDAMIQKIQDAQSKLALMSDTQKASMQDDIEKQKNAVIEFDKEKRTELSNRRDSKVREILTQIQGVVSTVAKKDGYTYILNDRVMIYGDPQFDLTDEVMKSLNESSK